MTKRVKLNSCDLSVDGQLNVVEKWETEDC